jgi:phospholipase C
MKRCIDVLLVFFLLFMLWGCGSGSSNTSSSTNAASGGNSSGSGNSSSGSTGGTTGSTSGTTTGTTGGTGGTTTPTTGSVQSVNHVIFMLQENRTFDTYFGMLNPYRKANGFNIGDDGNEYDVDGIDDKLTKLANVNDVGVSFPLFRLATACVDDMSSDWLASYGDVSRYNFTPARKILMDGFVHTAENYAEHCLSPCSSQTSFSDLAGERAMGYYDETFLNYYYYMASQFAVSDRWFSPISAKSTPNRIAVMSGGTTQGLTQDPYKNDKLQDLTPPIGQLPIATIFGELDKAGVSWKIYYTLTVGNCLDPDGDCGTSKLSAFPSTTFTDFQESYKYAYAPVTPGVCAPPTIPSLQAVGDSKNSFCIDPTHIAPLSQYYTDVANGTLPSYAFIEAGYGFNDEHPGNGNSILAGQVEMAKILNAFMNSPSWNDSIFFVSYDEGGGPYDHVPPVPGHTNDNTDASLGITTDISSIAVNPDSFFPCPTPINPITLVATPSQHCDVGPTDPGFNPGDAPALQGFAAQLGFRLPNMIVSPFTRRHYVSHTPMDHTAVIKFVESRFIGPTAHLTNRDAAQPNLIEFFDFTNVPWATPPTQTTTPPPTPVPDTGATCNAAALQ